MINQAERMKFEYAWSKIVIDFIISEIKDQAGCNFYEYMLQILDENFIKGKKGAVSQIFREVQEMSGAGSREQTRRLACLLGEAFDGGASWMRVPR